jgi:hypothetical protein
MDGGITLGTVPLSAGVGTCVHLEDDLVWFDIKAIYSGDANYAGSTSNTVSQVVNPANTVTTLTSSPSPSVWGQPVTLLATVDVVQPSFFKPTGIVTFYEGSAVLGTASLNVVTGQATLPTSSLSVGTHIFTATYSGDGGYSGSTSNPFTQVVNHISTTVTLMSSANPSMYGQSITFTATVIGNDGGIPAGTVTFYNGSTPLGTSTLNASGIATLTISSLSAGTNQITATDLGDAEYGTSTSNTLQQMVVTPTPWSQTTPVTISMEDMYGHATLTPMPTPTITPTDTSTPTLKPVPTPPSIPTSIPTVTPTEQNSGFPWWLIIAGIGVVAVAAIGYLFLRRQ